MSPTNKLRTTISLFLSGACIGCGPAAPLDQKTSNAGKPPIVADSPSATPTAKSEWEEQLQRITQRETAQLELSQPITAEQLEKLKSLPPLREILLDGGGVSDDSLDALLVHTDCFHLRLRQSPITDRGLEQLVAHLKSIRILNLPQAAITPDGIHSLGLLPKLTNLRLGGATIKDDAVEAMTDLPELESLHLIGPTLTDAALDSVARIKSLRSFYLDDCELSEEAWKQLFDKRKDIHIHIDQAHHDRDPNRHE